MKWMIGAGAALALAVAVVPTQAQDVAVKVGDKAPAFKLTGTDDKTYTLDQFKGKSAIVIAWYPKALTKGCTAECASIRDELSTLGKYQVQVFGASVDPVELNKQFKDQNKYNFVLLSDPEKTYAKQLGVLNAERGFANRWTYIIDKDGVVREIDKSVTTGTHGKDIAAKLEALGIPKK